jgi:hypothetical protein
MGRRQSWQRRGPARPPAYLPIGEPLVVSDQLHVIGGYAVADPSVVMVTLEAHPNGANPVRARVLPEELDECLKAMVQKREEVLAFRANATEHLVEQAAEVAPDLTAELQRLAAAGTITEQQRDAQLRAFVTGLGGAAETAEA